MSNEVILRKSIMEGVGIVHDAFVKPGSPKQASRVGYCVESRLAMLVTQDSVAETAVDCEGKIEGPPKCHQSRRRVFILSGCSGRRAPKPELGKTQTLNLYYFRRQKSRIC